jgi:hypothetical protein
VLVENSGYKIPNPSDGASADDPDDTYDDVEHAVVCDALKKSVDCPYNVKDGNAEDDLDDPRKIVYGFDKLVHWSISFSNRFTVLILAYSFVEIKCICRFLTKGQ